MNEMCREDQLTLHLLGAIEQDKAITQRGLARRLGVALGLANAYLKRCARKGLIEVQRSPPNQYSYHLTSAGLTEKANLAQRYFRSSLRFFREAGQEYGALFQTCFERGWRNVVLAGVSDLAEIAVLRSMNVPVEIAGIYDPYFGEEEFLGFAVDCGDKPSAATGDVVLLTGIEHVVDLYGTLKGCVGGARVLVPELLMPAVGHLVSSPGTRNELN